MIDLVDLLTKRLSASHGMTPNYDYSLMSRAKKEIMDLRKACVEAESTLREVLERHDDELTGSARGDVDNVRLDLLLASEEPKP